MKTITIHENDNNTQKNKEKPKNKKDIGRRIPGMVRGRATIPTIPTIGGGRTLGYGHGPGDHVKSDLGGYGQYGQYGHGAC